MLRVYFCGNPHLHGQLYLYEVLSLPCGPFHMHYHTGPFHQREPPLSTPVEVFGVVCPGSAREQDTQTQSSAPVTLILTW